MSDRVWDSTPTSAAVIASAEKYLSVHKASGITAGRTATVLTGSGLKTANKINKLFKESEV